MAPLAIDSRLQTGKYGRVVAITPADSWLTPLLGDDFRNQFLSCVQNHTRNLAQPMQRRQVFLHRLREICFFLLCFNPSRR